MNTRFSNKLNNLALKERKRLPFLLIVVAVLVIYIIVVLFLPMPEVKASVETVSVPPTTGSLSWPTDQQEAIGALNYGLLSTNGEQKSAPIASIAKCMVALSVLKEKPLKVGEQGPIYTITQKDVDLYSEDLAQNGSVVPVQVGESLTEYQLLQALLLPSGDNIATTLANWTYGSLDNYLVFANKTATDWGMTQTHFADASGLSPQTVSSAQDLVILGEKIMAEPILAEIVNQSEVTLPVAGKVKNYNTILGQENIIGIKTGNTNEAGGCFLFASKRNISGKDVVLIGAILGATSRNVALQDTKSFLKVNSTNFVFITVVKAGQTIGSYNLPWGKKVDIVAKDDLSVLTVAGGKITPKVNVSDINHKESKGNQVGEILVENGDSIVSVPLVLEDKISRPPFTWRLFHP